MAGDSWPRFAGKLAKQGFSAKTGFPKVLRIRAKCSKVRVFGIAGNLIFADHKP
jgi:hypothetical protein